MHHNSLCSEVKYSVWKVKLVFHYYFHIIIVLLFTGGVFTNTSGRINGVLIVVIPVILFVVVMLFTVIITAFIIYKVKHKHRQLSTANHTYEVPNVARPDIITMTKSEAYGVKDQLQFAMTECNAYNL